MKNLCRALSIALRFRWSLAGAILCSFLIAGTWGTNLAAVYPFVEVIFEGKTFAGWTEEKVQTLTASVQEINASIAASADPAEIKTLTDDLETARWKLDAHQAALPYIKDYLPGTPFKSLLLLVGFIVSMTMLRCGLLGVNMLLVKRVSQGVVFRIQNRLFRNLIRSDLAAMESLGTGTLAHQVQHEAILVGSSVETIFGRLLREPLKAGTCLFGAAMVNWRLLILSLLVCPFAFWVLARIGKAIKESTNLALRDAAGLMDKLVESLTYVKTIKSYNMESAQRREVCRTTSMLYKQQLRITWYDALQRANNEVLGTGVVCLSLLAGGYLVLTGGTHIWGVKMANGPMTFNTLVLFYSLLLGTTDPLRKLGGVHLNIRMGAISADRLFVHLDRMRRVKSDSHPVEMPREPASLRYENVTFGYREDQVVLDDISFDISAGQHIAIVGGNGCGKSTLIDLLPRFYDPRAGRILINEVPIDRYAIRDLRRYITVVSQQAALFDDTVARNIAYGAGRVSPEEIEAAADAAGALDFINDLPGRFDCQIGEHGGKLSGGQRQRLALARAILRDSPMVILDEATSQVDPESERIIHQALEKFLRGRTAIMITHRESTLTMADRILVMESGKLVGDGTRDQLLAHCPMFRTLWGQAELSEAA